MLIQFIIKYLLFKKRLNILDNKKSVYKNTANIVHYQIEQFNKIWLNAQKHQFYKNLKEEHCLPDKISSIDELNNFPVITKSILQKNKNIIFSNLKNYKTISTGGSTGEPTKFPYHKFEQEIQYANAYVGRGWWNIKPLDKIILIWGHSHLFGSGIKGKINLLKRSISDNLINTFRLSAYDLSEKSILNYIKEINKINPKVIIGYSSAILKIANFILKNNIPLKINALTSIIVTSETVFEEDKRIIEKTFNVPVIIEYGMAECGVIAYSNFESKQIDILWDSFIAQEIDNQLIITTLYDRAFPLIRYSTGDNIQKVSEINNSILSFESITGRTNDILEIKLLNTYIQTHSEFFTHVLKSIKSIESFKIIQYKKTKNILIEFVGNLDEKELESLFFEQTKKEFCNIEKSQFEFKHETDIPKTIAGKTKWVEIIDE